MTNSNLSPADIENRFGFHKATIEGDSATLPKHRDTRILPVGRARSVAFTELESASMWAHKAIAEQAPLIRE